MGCSASLAVPSNISMVMMALSVVAFRLLCIGAYDDCIYLLIEFKNDNEIALALFIISLVSKFA